MAIFNKIKSDTSLSLSFLKQFIVSPRTIGSVIPSSRFLANRITSPIDFASARCIIELGSGTGAFTKVLLRKKNTNTKLILIELNKSFCKMLGKKYESRSDILIVNDCATKLENILKEQNISQADYIISGLPFTNFPTFITDNILSNVRQGLGINGKLILFQYTKLKQKQFSQFFSCVEISRVFCNFPPAYVFTCHNLT